MLLKRTFRCGTSIKPNQAFSGRVCCINACQNSGVPCVTGTLLLVKDLHYIITTLYRWRVNVFSSVATNLWKYICAHPPVAAQVVNVNIDYFFVALKAADEAAEWEQLARNCKKCQISNSIWHFPFMNITFCSGNRAKWDQGGEKRYLSFPGTKLPLDFFSFSFVV